MEKYIRENHLRNALVYDRIPKEAVPALLSHSHICMAHLEVEGHKEVYKARGRQAALKALVDRMEETAIDSGSLTVFISHGDCLEDAQTVERMVRDRFGVQEIYINYVGPVIGAHSGPGTVALFYVGTNR